MNDSSNDIADTSNPAARSADPMQLSMVLALSANTYNIWSESDLSDMLAHQLSVPLLFDLGKLGGAPALAAALAGSTPIANFRDLFFHPAPPLDLVLLAKDFAKDATSNPEGRPPEEISTLIYYVSIGVARLRHGQRITRMDDARLREGFLWALSLPWIDETFRDLLRQCLGCLPAQAE